MEVIFKEVNMIDRKYSINHINTAHLPPPELSVAEILLNINADNKDNFFSFMLGVEDERDGITVNFEMSYHSDFSMFLELPPELLDELVKRYALHDFHEPKSYDSWSELLADEGLKNSQKFN